MTSYEVLRRQARTLESVLDAKMTSYSRMGMAVGDNWEEDRWTNLEAEVEGLFEKVRKVSTS